MANKEETEAIRPDINTLNDVRCCSICLVPINGQNLCVTIKFSNKDRLFFLRVIKPNGPAVY